MIEALGQIIRGGARGGTIGALASLLTVAGAYITDEETAALAPAPVERKTAALAARRRWKGRLMKSRSMTVAVMFALTCLPLLAGCGLLEKAGTLRVRVDPVEVNPVQVLAPEAPAGDLELAGNDTNTRPVSSSMRGGSGVNGRVPGPAPESLESLYKQTPREWLDKLMECQKERQQ